MLLSLEKILDFIVLIPHFDDPQGLSAAIKSIRFDRSRYGIVVVDDGSQEPPSLQFLQSISSTDSLYLIRLDTNRGITDALNAGLDFIDTNLSARYIARLDCSDICHPERFSEQLNFLDSHPTVNLLGSWCFFSETGAGKKYLYKTPQKLSAIQRGMHFRNLFIHPTMMWRHHGRERTRKYADAFPNAEDYALAYSFFQDGEVAILPNPLVTCQLKPKGLSFGQRNLQLKSRAKVVRRYGTNPLFRALGQLKLFLLQQIPVPWILNFKFFFYRMQQSTPY